MKEAEEEVGFEFEVERGHFYLVWLAENDIFDEEGMEEFLEEELVVFEVFDDLRDDLNGVLFVVADDLAESFERRDYE